MNISQIFLTSEKHSRIPRTLLDRTDTFTKGFPGTTHVIYQQNTLRLFIEENFSKEILDAYDTLVPMAYKADLGRYCLLYKLGGWYFDVACRLNMPLRPSPEVELLAFRDIQRYSRTACSCAIGCLYARPGAEALQIAIEMIVDNVKNQYYGLTPLCPTGPTLFGRALAQHGADSRYLLGDYLELTRGYQNVNRAFVLPNGTILAWGKECAGGDLKALGAIKTDNYNVHWANRAVYNTPEVKREPLS